MAIYSVGRRRVILALILTSALLLTFDLRGNPVIDRVRDAMAVVLSPVETAVGVVTTPAERAWNGIVNYDDLRRENEALQDELDRMVGTQAAGEAAVLQAQEILALNNLPSLAGYDTELARVVGGAANNIDQVIEINKGRNSGIDVGMPVTNQAGLIGKVTSVTETTARVMLVTDTRYSIGVNVVAGDVSIDGDSDADDPVTTSPSGKTAEEIDEEANASTSTSSTTSTTLADGQFGVGPPTPDTTLPGGGPTDSIPSFTYPETGEPIPPEVLIQMAAEEEAAKAAAAEEAAAEEAAGGTTTTTEPVVVRKEFGSLEGRGRRLLPQIRFVQDNPTLAELQVGDLVETAGGSLSLAPPGIPVGRVVNRADRPGSGGPLLDVEPHADLTRLNYVRVVIYKSPSETGGS